MCLIKTCSMYRKKKKEKRQAYETHLVTVTELNGDNQNPVMFLTELYLSNYKLT